MPLASNDKVVAALVVGVLNKFEVVTTVALNEGSGVFFDIPNIFCSDEELNAEQFFCAFV